MNPEPRTYPAGEPLPECESCHERSIDSRLGCLNPDCPSSRTCEWCGEREATMILLGDTEDRLCLPCGREAVRAILAGVTP